MKVKLPAPFTCGKILPFFAAFSFCLANLQAQPIALGLTTQRPLNNDWFGYDMSTTVRGGTSCADPNLKSHLPALKAKLLRFPSGSFSNWYDWHEGWYIDSPDLPVWDQTLTKVPNKLEDFKGLLDVSGAGALINLNMLTSDLHDQIAMLKHADSIGIDLKYIELGEEFYLGDEEADTSLVLGRYPTAASYGDTAAIWIDSLRKYFPDAKFAVQGIFDKSIDPRKLTWNESVTSHVTNEDAMTFHYYYASAVGDSAETDAEKLDVNYGDMPDMFYQPFKAWDLFQDNGLAQLPPGKEAWVTEYNLSDHIRPIHGTWASGLYTALHTMQMLQDERITHVNLHGVSGQAVFGALFYDTYGYNFGLLPGAHYVGPATQPMTDAWGLTAYGNTMSMMGNALDGKMYASKMNFSPNPQVMVIEKGDTFYYDGLFGYFFSDASHSQAIILNLTDTVQKIKTTVMFPQGGSYEMRYADVIKLVAVASDVTITNKSSLPDNLNLKPYSITRISANTVPPPPPAASLTANGPTTFCEGDSVQLNAGSGYSQHIWSTGSTKQKIWVKETGDYWVHEYKEDGGYYAEASIHVTVNPNPKTPGIITVGKKSFCAGGSVEIELAPSYNDSDVTYFWPLTGSTSSSISATASGNYSLIVTNEFGCSAASDIETVTVYPLPQPIVSAVGSSSACAGVNVTLQVLPLGYVNYKWSNGGWGQTKTFTTTGNYNVEVTDLLGCKATSNSVQVTIWDPPNPVVTAMGPTAYCEGSTGSYLTTLPGYNYKWMKGNATVSGATNQNYTPTGSGNYKAKITDTHGCSKTSSAGVSVTVNKNPTASISIGGGTNICNGQSRTLTANGGSGSQYQWKKNGSTISGATGKTYVTSVAGSFSCMITNTFNCSALSNTITTTTNCKEDGSGTGDAQSVSWLVYPNPASDALHVQLNLENSESGVCAIEIRNLLGEVILKRDDSYSGYKLSSDFNLDPALPSGVYFVIVRLPGDVYHAEFEIEK